MKIALAGNQNCGKTTLFNLLTGMNAKIGNWPGVTIEKKSGIIKGTKHEIIDLPGIYSLSPYSNEEEVSRRFIFDEKPDMIINIVDATSIERGLYLTTQLMELDCKMIIALNMTDLLEKRGISIDILKMKNMLGVKVLKISALKETGINELLSSIDKVVTASKTRIYDSNIEDIEFKIEGILPNKIYHKRFIAIKLVEGDERFNNIKNRVIKESIDSIKNKYDTDLEEVIAEERYKYITTVKKECICQRKKQETISDVLDKIFLNRILAFPIFATIMLLIYYFSVGVVGNYTTDYMCEKIVTISKTINTILMNLGTSKWLISLIVDGIVRGVGTVISFIPQLVILFILISILETTGYMSRIALLLDKIFRRIGLNGKSLIPFIVGSGCSVPGILGTRIIENEDERKITSVLVPFIPCSAKLPIIVLFSGSFFPENSGVISVSLYFLAICIIILSAILINKFIIKHAASTYISELPEYKMANMKYVLRDSFNKIFAFVRRAGTTILLCSIIIWFLLSFSFKMEYGICLENSMLAETGKKISWIFCPMLGTNSWGATVSAMQGLVAKEQVVSSMAVINGLTESTIEKGMFSEKGVFGFFTASSAYAFMVFNLFSAPCFATIAAMKKELGSIKNMLKAVTFQTCLAWLLSVVVYQIGSRIENGTIHIADILIVAFIVMILLAIIISHSKKENSECIRCPYNKACDKK